LAKSYGDVLQWIKSAEEAIRKHDYEVAARFFRYVTVYFGLLNDTPNQRKFAIRTGECYLQSAEKSASLHDPFRAILLCIKAASYFQEGGSEELARVCHSIIRQHYISVKKDSFTGFHEDPHDLKGVGDYFAKNGDFERAIECYQTAAEKAFKEEKLALSSGLYRDAGNCYQRLKDSESAAKIYATAAEMYSRCQEYFEAAWHYCQSGFLFIQAGRLDEATLMARKAGSACGEGRIDVLLNDLCHICTLLGERSLSEAEERWHKVRMKFKRSYANLIDSCFQALGEKPG